MKLEMLSFFSSDFLERLVFVLYFGKQCHDCFSRKLASQEFVFTAVLLGPQ